MKTLVEGYSKNKGKLNPIVTAAYFHTAFELVHPFVDGIAVHLGIKADEDGRRVHAAGPEPAVFPWGAMSGLPWGSWGARYLQRM